MSNKITTKNKHILGETYDIRQTSNKHVFTFVSTGASGTVKKVVLFEPFGSKFNLAFGDYFDGKIHDETISNNLDPVKVISTVAQCVYLFVFENPGCTLLVQPVDFKRQRFYNHIFRRHHTEIAKRFVIWGYADGAKTLYDPNAQFESFELDHISI